MNTLKKTMVTACAIAAISLTALGTSTTAASAGWKKHKLRHHFIHRHFYKPHFYGHNYGYRCKPKYRKIWVWSPRKGRKIKRWVKVGKWCNGRYYDYY